MFNTGEKVIALISSLGKTSGPRKGSVGYVISPGEHNAYVDELKAFLCMINVMFIRFGFENKIRKERKVFLNVFPVIYDRVTDNKLKEIIDSLIKGLQTENLKGGVWKRIKEEWFPQYSNMAPTGILVPVCDNRIDLLRCDTLEFMAWLDTYLMSTAFRKVVSTIMSAKRPKKIPVNGKALAVLQSITSDKDAKKHYLSQIRDGYSGNGNDPGRLDIIEAVRALNAISGNREIKSKIDHVRHILHNDKIFDGNGRIKHILVYRLLVDRAFSSIISAQRAIELNSLGNQRMDRVVSNTKRLTDMLGALSFPLLRANNDEKEVIE